MSYFGIAVEEATRLYNAIKKHYDGKGLDRSVMDEELYAAAGLPLPKSYAELEVENAALRAERDRLKAELARYSMEAGRADQYRAEARAARSALLFPVDGDNVSPSMINEGIRLLKVERYLYKAERDRLKTKLDNLLSWHPEYEGAERRECDLASSEWDWMG